VHVFIGIGEGLISAGAVAFVLASRPDLVRAVAGRAVEPVTLSSEST
jgi:hypothetical protein